MGRRVLLALLSAAVLVGLVAQPGSAVNVPQAAVVSSNPADWTPHVLDGKVAAIVQVGNKIVAARLGISEHTVKTHVNRTMTKLAALTSGELDFAGIQPAHAEFVRRNPELAVVTYPLLFSYSIVLNTRRPPFDDLTTRKRLAAAVDQRTIAEIVGDPARAEPGEVVVRRTQETGLLSGRQRLRRIRDDGRKVGRLSGRGGHRHAQDGGDPHESPTHVCTLPCSFPAGRGRIGARRVKQTPRRGEKDLYTIQSAPRRPGGPGDASRDG